MLGIVWFWLAAAGPCWAAVPSVPNNLEQPRREDLALDQSQQFAKPSTDSLSNSGAHAPHRPHVAEDADRLLSWNVRWLPASTFSSNVSEDA
jgi:hypothetical protein